MKSKVRGFDCNMQDFVGSKIIHYNLLPDRSLIHLSVIYVTFNALGEIVIE
jgi:hypothetical protein